MTPKIIEQIVQFFGKKLDTMAVEIKGAEVVTIKGIQGEKGDTGAPGKDSTVVGPVGPKGDRGDSGKDGESIVGPKGDQGDSGRDGESIVGPKGDRGDSGKPGTDGSPDTPTEIIEKINKEKGTLIKKEKVEGLADIEIMARSAQANTNVFHNSGSFVYDYDISSLLDGVTKVFALPSNAKVIAVFGSSTPGIFRKTVDYVATSSITFTSNVDETTTLSAGQTVIILYKIL